MSQLDRRQVLKLFGGLTAAGTLAACSGESSDPTVESDEPLGDRIVIGLISPATGPNGRIGSEITNGFRLFLHEHSQRLGRHDVDLKIADEGSTPTSARAAVESLLSQNVLAIAGTSTATAVLSARDPIEQAKTPLICANAAPKDLPGAFYIWRASHLEGEAGSALASYAVAHGSRAYVLRAKELAGNEDANGFVKAFSELNGKVVGDTLDSADPAGLVEDARRSRADVIFCSYTGNQARDLLRAFQQANLDAILVGPAALTETFDVSKVTPLPKRVFTAANYAPDLDNDANRRFVSAYHLKYGAQPSTTAMAAYDCAAILDRALRMVSGELSPFVLNKYLSLLGQVDSPRGLWTFNITRSAQQMWYLRQLRLDGQMSANLLAADLAVMG